MALIIPPGYSQLVMRMTLTGDPEPIVNTIGVQHGVSIDFQDLVNALDVAWKLTPGIRAEVSNQYAFVGCTLYVGQDGGPPAIYESTNPPEQGGGAGAPLPQNCGVLVTKRTAVAGRRNKGRWYVAGIGEGAVDATGTIAGVTVTAWQNAVNATFANMQLGTAVDDLVILHTAGGTTPPGLPTPITQMVVQSKMATQRRRLRP